MELRDYLDVGAKKAGSLTNLGKVLDMSQPRMSNAKAHRKPLPIDAIIKLADYISVDLRALIAANELVTEKKEEKRAFWTPFTELGRAAVFMLALVCALVTNFVTPTPANATPALDSKPDMICIMLSRLQRFGVKKAAVVQAVRTTLRRVVTALLFSGFSGVAHTA